MVLLTCSGGPWPAETRALPARALFQRHIGKLRAQGSVAVKASLRHRPHPFGTIIMSYSALEASNGNDFRVRSLASDLWSYSRTRSTPDAWSACRGAWISCRMVG